MKQKIKNRPILGVQNPVMGYADPFHPETSLEYLRTGEQQFFPPQDVTPSAEKYMQLIRDTLGAEFLMHHAIPCDTEISNFIDLMNKNEFYFMLGNEFYSINKVYAKNTARGEIPESLRQKAAYSKFCMGLLYDETEHRQLHNKQYDPLTNNYEWANPQGKSPYDIENEITENVKKLVSASGGLPIYSEHVFPLLYHVLARGGMQLCPKILKEEFQPIQLAIAMGAAKQYKTSLGICVDLWGFDVGNWFTRLWGFPAHSPAEFKSGLELAFRLSPDMMFVENIDVLAQNTTEGFQLTEFGRIFQDFIEIAKKQTLPYHHSDVLCDIAVIRWDDSMISKIGNFKNTGRYGSQSLMPDEKCNSFFDVMYGLTHQTTSNQALTYYNSNFFHWPSNAYERNDETLKSLPLANGVGVKKEKTLHPIFHPMKSTLVFDPYVKTEDLEGAKLIIVCGSELSQTTPAIVAKLAEKGACCVIARWFEALFAPYIKAGENWHIVDNFASNNFNELILPYIGKSNEWTIKFKQGDLSITNPSCDGRELVFDFLQTT